jgi:hypothetical protein
MGTGQREQEEVAVSRRGLAGRGPRRGGGSRRRAAAAGGPRWRPAARGGSRRRAAAAGGPRRRPAARGGSRRRAVAADRPQLPARRVGSATHADSDRGVCSGAGAYAGSATSVRPRAETVVAWPAPKPAPRQPYRSGAARVSRRRSSPSFEGTLPCPAEQFRSGTGGNPTPGPVSSGARPPACR